MPRYPYLDPYDDDRDDINIEFRRGGRPEYVRPGAGRYNTDSNVRLHAHVNTYERASSRDRRYSNASPPSAPPVNIYNYNVDEDARRPGGQPAPMPQVIPNMQMPGAFMPAMNAMPQVPAAPPRPTELTVKLDTGKGRSGRSRSRDGRRRRHSSSDSSRSRDRSRDREREYWKRKEREEKERRYFEEERIRREREEKDRLDRLYDRDRRDSKDKYMTKEEYEYELTRRELESLRKKMRDLERDGKKEEKKEEKAKGYMTKEEYELERTRKELAAFKMEQQKEEEKRLMKKEMELKALREEKEREEEEERKKKAAEQAVKEHMEKERKKKEEAEHREKEYQKRLRDDLKKSGLDDEQIEKVLKKEKLTVEKVEKKRPTYTRMARRWLSFETLNAFRLDYTMDQDPDYILIKRWVPEDEQDQLWEHTKAIRERRQRLLTENTTTTTVLQIEDSHQRRSGRLSTGQYEFVKKRRDKSPAPGLITFFAGGKR